MDEEVNLDQLLDDAATGTQSCFAQSLTGQAKEFLELVVRARNEEKRKVVLTKAHRILRDKFGVKRGVSVVTAHIRGDCSCPKKSTT